MYRVEAARYQKTWIVEVYMGHGKGWRKDSEFHLYSQAQEERDRLRLQYADVRVRQIQPNVVGGLHID
jgi:hypothetical protein